MATQEPYSTTIDIAEYARVRDLALMAHGTQIDPESPFWFGLPEEIRDTIYPLEHYRLAISRVGAIDVVEDDLFAGLSVDAAALAPPSAQ